MIIKLPHDLQMSYLRAIQKIPGDTASEKLCWIGKLTLYQSSSDLEQFPPELLPILNVETAIKEKKHEDITFALKCEDSAIINRAFKAFWFFDGSHKEIVNVRYFFEHLFPYVSVKTRTRIVLTLAHQLSGKDPIFAQEIFTEMVSIYGIRTAYPLIIACNETFAYEIIVQKELVLPVKIVEKIFYINPDLAVRFLKLLKPHPYRLNATEHNPFAIGIGRYASLLPKLIKKRLEAFIELFEIHSPKIILSNKCSKIFLKKAQQHLILKPQLYIRILPLKKINKDLMEKIFPDLLPTTMSYFRTGNMLYYLEHYPRDKQYDLLRKSYKDKYNVDLLDETKNVTLDLLQLLPVEERIKQAKIKILEEHNLEKSEYQEFSFYKTAWICYLPVNEVIPIIKEKLNKTTGEKDRIDLLMQMIYACNVNKDDNALFSVLTYFLNRHKNENSRVFQRIFHQLLEIYNLPYLNEKLISLVLDIVRLCYVKHEFIPERILVAIIHFKLIHNMSIEELIDMFLKSNTCYESFNILKEYPQYERQCLVTFANQIEKKSFKEDEKKYFFCKLFEAIYDFNNRYKKSCTKIEKMTIRDYPWLMDVIYEILRSGKNSILKNILQENEPELYCSWFPSNIANVTSGAALALLKRDSRNVLDNWEEYLANCMKNYNSKHVQRFIKATRWYKDLPIKFFERCMNYIYDKNTDKIPSCLVVLALLCHGDELTKLIDPFIIPTKTRININHPNAKNNYKLIKYLPLSMRLSNPPIPLDLIVRLCEGEYLLRIVLMTLTNVSMRTSKPKVLSIAQKLMSMCVNTRKHGVRLMYLIATKHELTDFLQKAWIIEKHHSVRQVLFKTFQKYFLTEPNPETWSLYYQTVSTLSLNDEALLSQIKLFPKIPNKYVLRFLDLWLKTIDDFQGMELDDQKKNKYIANFLATLTTASIFNLLSEEFIENILRRFLFHMDSDVSRAARRFIISYILSEGQDKNAARIKIFADVFRNAVVNYWDVPHPKKLYFYPINQAVRLFIDDFIFYCFDKMFYFNKFTTNPEIIDNIQMIFSSVLSPSQDAKSYLLLTYAKTFQECKSTKNSFGLKLGQQLHELINIFSPLLVSFMVQILDYFLDKVYRYPDLEQAKFSVIEGLIEAGNTYSCFMAVTMLPGLAPKPLHPRCRQLTIKMNHAARYDRIIEKLRGMHEELATMTVLCNYLNELDLNIFETN
ncbi:PREDICTED: uncharacterized protein LOC108772070 [Cyphomyrmex costatus]|uniref:uncharacterized protein LOC108772070 n=1 Tax=Cyphomyrmex costatus TaxID=456900 RepID=UPI0008522089|nr:PREDICTED: uncharacterized protein LOC108772070 [Cyphomyrmex costatus]